jgi:hypothetical protein
MADWYDRACVKRKQRIIIAPEDSRQKSFFSPTLSPISQHPLVNNKRLSGDMQVHYLYNHLQFTTKLEMELINPVVGEIALGKTGIILPVDMRKEAFQIYTDEAYHGCVYYDAGLQVEKVTGIRPLLPSFHYFHYLELLESLMPPELKALVKIAAVIVSETLISGTLSLTIKDKRIIPGVQELIADHASDETYHRQYFTRFFPFFWSQLSSKDKEQIASLFPELINSFLKPDNFSFKLVLQQAGFTSEEILRIIEESYSPGDSQDVVQQAAKHTISLLEEYQVLEVSKYDAFKEAEKF